MSSSTSATHQKQIVVDRHRRLIDRLHSARRLSRPIFLWAIILLGLTLMVMPGIWMVLASFKTQAEISAVPLQFWPTTWRLTNYTEAIEVMKFWRVLTNSLTITAAVTIANIFTATWGGYTFGKLRWPGRDIALMLLLLTLMIPSFLTLIPRYVLVAKLGLLNSYGGMTIPCLVSALGIFLARQFMLGIPDELLDAAEVDGCSAVGIYWRIVLPLSKPTIAVLAIFTIDRIWDDLLWGTMILTDREKWTLPIAIANLRAQGSNQYDLQMAGSTLAVIPIIILFIVLQRHIIQGVALSGLKG